MSARFVYVPRPSLRLVEQWELLRREVKPGRTFDIMKLRDLNGRISLVCSDWVFETEEAATEKLHQYLTRNTRKP